MAQLIYTRTGNTWAPHGWAPNETAARQMVAALMDQRELGRDALTLGDIRQQHTTETDPPRRLRQMRQQCEEWNRPVYAEELTAIGPQLVIPGCERRPVDNGKPAQLSLF